MTTTTVDQRGHEATTDTGSTEDLGLITDGLLTGLRHAYPPFEMASPRTSPGMTSTS